MKEAHHHMHVSDDAFDAIAMALAESLRTHHMDEADISIMLHKLEEFRGEIVSNEK
jgi:hypothetical protein